MFAIIFIVSCESSKFSGEWNYYTGSSGGQLTIKVSSAEGMRGKCYFSGHNALGQGGSASGDWSGSESGNTITLYLLDYDSEISSVIPSQMTLEGNALIDEYGHRYIKQ